MVIYEPLFPCPRQAQAAVSLLATGQYPGQLLRLCALPFPGCRQGQESGPIGGAGRLSLLLDKPPAMFPRGPNIHRPGPHRQPGAMTTQAVTWLLLGPPGLAESRHRHSEPGAGIQSPAQAYPLPAPGIARAAASARSCQEQDQECCQVLCLFIISLPPQFTVPTLPQPAQDLPAFLRVTTR